MWILNGFFSAIPYELEQAAWLDGASKFTALWRITLPLALPGLVTCVIFTFVAAWNEFAMARALVFGDRGKWPLTLGLTYILVALVDATAVAGVLGGGGLGNLAMTYGYQRFDWFVVIVIVVILIVLVQSAQLVGNWISRKVLHR